MTALDLGLLSRIEDASLNASAPPQQRWVDGWLLCYCPGKARRARSIQAVASGRLSNAERLAICEAVFVQANLPLFVRVTPFSQPPGLDDWLAEQGLHWLDETRVMVATRLPAVAPDLPPELALLPAGPQAYAEAVGALRGSPTEHRSAHAQRLALSPVPYSGWLLRRRSGGAGEGELLACAQSASEANMVGLYDVFTAPAARGQGLSGLLCATVLARAQQSGASTAYLQVDASNAPAIKVYQRLGFIDGYRYHYLARDPHAV